MVIRFNGDWLKIIWNIIFIIVLSCGLGLIALMAAFSIPKNRIIDNVKESVSVFEREGTYPDLVPWCASKLDNYTDAYMLLGAAYDGRESTIEQAMNVFHQQAIKKNPVETLISCFGENAEVVEDVQIAPYARYWHGYLIFLKPLLKVFNYQEIRWINLLVQTIINLLVLYHLKKYDLKQYILPYILALGCIMPAAIGYSMQFSTCFYVFSIGILVLIRNYHSWKQNENRWFMYFFLILGILTSYFDFLTYPMATLGMPLVIYFCLEKKAGKVTLRKQITALMKLAICWGSGYVGMWSGKWIIATMVCEDNIILDAVKQVLLRTSASDSKGQGFAYIEVLFRNVGYFVMTPVVILCFIYVLLKIRAIWKQENRKQLLSEMLIFIFISFVPIAWYLVTANHAYIHCWFTNKALIASAFSVMCMVTGDGYNREIGEDIFNY